MMLMAMRVDKSQMSPIYRYTSPVTTAFTDRDKAIMFGYTSYQALLVGGAGGRSGTATGSPNRYGSGGGGGSSKLISGSLSSLAASEPITVGSMGTFGADGSTSGAGGRGGNTTFRGFTAWGGYGGYSANTPDVANKGGEGANPDGSKGPTGAWEGVQYAGNGTWNSTTLEGSGGGGGSGSGQLDSAHDGGSGAGGAYSAPGEAVLSGVYGGGGGGANEKPLTGVDGYHGSGWGRGQAIGNGAVIIALS